ncbi:MAG: hypothetical protein R6X02_18880 [Enhygromyxa sp.]
MHALHRLVVRRSPEGSVAPGVDQCLQVDPPALAGVRLVFGVGSTVEDSPSADDFHPAYTISMPVISLGGLDPDGVYEFDAGAQLELLQSRATRRRWAVRLELELVQTHQTINAAELWFESPWRSGDPRPVLLGPERGEPRPGGGRALVFASTPVASVVAARALGGRFVAQIRDADPHGGGPATIESPPLLIEVDCARYEFEDELEHAGEDELEHAGEGDLEDKGEQEP